VKIISSRETVPKNVRADLLNKCSKKMVFETGKALLLGSRVKHPTLVFHLDRRWNVLRESSPIIYSLNTSCIQSYVILKPHYFISCIKNNGAFLLSCLEFGCINRHPLFIQAQIFGLTYPFMIHGRRKCYVLRVTNDITLYGILGFVNMSFLKCFPCCNRSYLV